MPATPEQCAAYRQRLKRRAIAKVAFLYGMNPLDLRCESCGARYTMLAHCRPTGLNGAGRGLGARYIDVLRNTEAYRPLCNRCHRDSGGPNDHHTPVQ